jgi:hypothetical protein
LPQNCLHANLDGDYSFHDTVLDASRTTCIKASNIVYFNLEKDGQIPTLVSLFATSVTRDLFFPGPVRKKVPSLSCRETVPVRPCLIGGSRTDVRAKNGIDLRRFGS